MKYLFALSLPLVALCLCIPPCHGNTAEKNRDEIQKKFRAAIYKQTQEACLKGYTYSSPANSNELSSVIYKIHSSEFKKMQKGTFVKHNPAPLKFPGHHTHTAVKVYKTGSIETGQLLKNKGYHPVVLNFANKSHVGGGVERGALAQEEDLFRRSSYFLGLDINHNSYLRLQMEGKYQIPEFGAIYTPFVHIIRGPEKEGFPFIPAFQLDFIACAAYNLTPRDNDAPASEKEYLEGMKKKIRAILRVGVLTHHDAIVLGAFGCGAFKNNPKIVAPLFREVIQEPEFQGQYKLIAFGIPENGSNNYAIFRESLDGIDITLDVPASSIKKMKVCPCKKTEN